MNTSGRAFRFGLQVSSLPTDSWQSRVKEIEALGFSTLFVEDHFGVQWEPQTALPAIAGASSTLNVGSLVYGVDFRHPVIMAKAAATLQLLSNGRHEFGLGAGWMADDYTQSGIAYERPGIRIARLEEALQIIKMMWTQEKTSFSGEHYNICDIPQAGEIPASGPPKIMVGGGGKRLLSVAGRYADIIGLNPSLPQGKATPEAVRQMTPEGVLEKVNWAMQAAENAGRNFSDIELTSLVLVVALNKNAQPTRQAIASQTGMSDAQVRQSPLFLTGSAQEVCDSLEQRREKTGVSYIVIQDGEHVEQFARSVIESLVGK